MARITLDGVSKRYPAVREGELSAVRSLSFHADDGEFVVLLGPSGCGKSTTLRMIAGLETPTKGEIRIDDRVMNAVPPRERDVAMVFQNAVVYPHLRVRENLGFALSNRGVSSRGIDQRVAEAAEMLGLSQLLDRRPSELSGGERQRVALGRAIVRRAKVWLLDEPLSSLDASLRMSMRAQIKSLQRTLGATMIYVTHDQDEAMSLADRLVIMSAGEIRQIGTPMEIYRRPADRWIAGFFGTPSTSFLEGQLVAEDDQLVFVEDSPQTNTVSSSSWHWRLPDAFAAALTSHVGDHVTLGIRPHGFRYAQAGKQEPSEKPLLRVRVELVEPLGDQVDVHCVTTAGTQLVARVPVSSFGTGFPAIGEPLAITVDPASVMVFEPGEAGKRLFSPS